MGGYTELQGDNLLQAEALHTLDLVHNPYNIAIITTCTGTQSTCLGPSHMKR